MGIVSYLQMQVRGPALHGDAQQVINIHSTLPPNNLPYDEPKSHSPQDDLSNDEGRDRDKPFGLKDHAGYTPLGKSVIPGAAGSFACERSATSRDMLWAATRVARANSRSFDCVNGLARGL